MEVLLLIYLMKIWIITYMYIKKNKPEFA